VACTQLGFAGGMVASFKAGKVLPIRVGRLTCFGNETRLGQCDINTDYWAIDCTPSCYDGACQYEDAAPAGVICRQW